MQMITSVSLLDSLLFSFNNTILFKCFLVTMISVAVNNIIIYCLRIKRSKYVYIF